MERVTGIGGFFFRSRDPRALAAWYEERLGIRPAPQSYDGAVWRQERYPNGRFARLRDPEGNGIQLWQPMQPG